MQHEASPNESTTTITNPSAQRDVASQPLPPHIQPAPRPPITQLNHVPRHHKRVMMLVTIAVVVILIAIAIGYHLGTVAPKHTYTW